MDFICTVNGGRLTDILGFPSGTSSQVYTGIKSLTHIHVSSLMTSGWQAMWGIAEQTQQHWEKQLDTVTKWDS